MSLLRRLVHAARRLDSRSLRILLSLGLVVGVGATGTFAAWSDTATVQGTSITAGTIDLKLNGANDNVTGYTTMNIGNMVPGNTTAGVITVKNNGTAPLKYYLDASAGGANALFSALQAKVTGDAATSGASPAVVCPGTALASSSSTFGSGLLSAASPRLLAAGATENICIQATLPSNAASTLQGVTANITFTFTGNSF